MAAVRRGLIAVGLLSLSVACALLATALLFGTAAHAEDVAGFDVSQLEGGPTIGPSDVLEDPSGSLRFEDVVRGPRSAGFRPTGEATFGFSESAFWLRFTAHNPSDAALPWLLELPYPHLDHVDLYTLHADGRVEHVVAGDLLPFRARAVDVPTFVFPQQTQAHAATQYYLRAQSGGAVRVPLRAWRALDFISHESKHDLVLWLFYGAVLVMICYNLGVAALLRQHEYLLHVGQLVCVGGGIFSLSGQTFQYLLPDAPALANRALALSLALGLLFVQLYSRAVTRNFEALTNMVRLYRYTVPPAVLLVPVALLSKWGLRAVFVGVGLYVPFGFYKIICVYRSRLPALRFYQLSFLSLAVCIPIAMMAHAKLVPAYPLAIWAAHLGAAGYAVLAALALPARVNVMSERLAGLNTQLSKNVTDLRMALTRAEQATEEARSATKVKDEFMATMSHELRTPLNAIINVPQGLLDDFPTVRTAVCAHCQVEFYLEPEEQFTEQTACEACASVGTLREAVGTQYTGQPAHTARFLKKIERSGQHLLQMVNGVLDFSKMEAGHLELQLEPLDFKSLLTESIDAMSDLAARRQLSVELTTVETSEPGLGDGLRLRQVLLNLISNAIKFSEPGGQIFVSWQRDEESDTISVRDLGIGIAREDHERVFASFEQVHKGDTRKYGGTGLGLSISRSLVRMHGGELWVDSQLGMGATFRFRIPRRGQHSFSSPPRSSSAA